MKYVKAHIQNFNFVFAFDFKSEVVYIYDEELKVFRKYELNNNVDCIAEVYNVAYRSFIALRDTVKSIRRKSSFDFPDKYDFTFSDGSIEKDADSIKNKGRGVLPLWFEPNLLYLKRLKSYLRDEVKLIKSDPVKPHLNKYKKQLKNMRAYVRSVDLYEFVSQYMVPPLTEGEIKKFYNLELPLSYLVNRAYYLRRYSKEVLTYLLDLKAKELNVPFVMPADLCRDACSPKSFKFIQYLWAFEHDSKENDVKKLLKEVSNSIVGLYIFSSRRKEFLSYVEKYNAMIAKKKKPFVIEKYDYYDRKTDSQISVAINNDSIFMQNAEKLTDNKSVGKIVEKEI